MQILSGNRVHSIPGGDQGMVEISEEDQKRLLAEYEEELKKGDESGKHSRRSSGTQLSSSSSGSFAFVTVRIANLTLSLNISFSFCVFMCVQTFTNCNYFHPA
jgi:hypothetical protein